MLRSLHSTASTHQVSLRIYVLEYQSRRWSLGERQRALSRDQYPDWVGRDHTDTRARDYHRRPGSDRRRKSLGCPRGGYRIESIIYRDGERIDTGGKEVRGVGTLQPAYARVPVEFHRFGDTTGGTDLPPISFTVEDVTDNRTRLNVSAYLTNAGDEPIDDLRLSLVARQADSNIVADRAEVPLRNLTTGATATPTAPLTVPEGYNYYLDAILWHEGTIVGTTRAAANLNPSQNLSVSPPQSEGGLQISDFESEGDRATEADGETSGADGPVSGVDASGPGFGISIALVAMLVVGFGVWRHSQ